MKTLTIAALFLVFPAMALAKGPSEATIVGPGLRAPLKIDGSGSWGTGTPFEMLVEETAFFAATWGGDHTYPILRARPAGELGPRYRVTFRVPGPAGKVDRIRQDLYPHARGGPVAFTPPGQRLFDRETVGGWYRGKPRLRTTLIAAGLPPDGPAARPVLPSRDGSTGDRTLPAAGLALLLVALLTAAGLLIRRSPRTASAG